MLRFGCVTRFQGLSSVNRGVLPPLGRAAAGTLIHRHGEVHNLKGSRRRNSMSDLSELCLMRENTVFNSLGSRTISYDSKYKTHLQEVMFELYRDGGMGDSHHLYLDRETFKKCVVNSIGVIGKALKNQLVIPDWLSFTTEMSEISEESRQYTDGDVATYIPQLARANPSSWAASVYTIDGQRRSWGDAFKPFCLDSVSKPFTYAMVHDEFGPEKRHSHIGQEPSGRLFNYISLDHNKKPHNPLINPGAIVVASLMKKNASLSDRFDFAIRQMRRFCGNGYVGFNNAVFLSERETVDRNYALSYYMREHNVPPRPNANLQNTLDLFSNYAPSRRTMTRWR